MARSTITRETLRALFAKSGNVCAFPGCNEELITSRNVFVGQICHIEAANLGGPRFNKYSTDDERRSFDNLLLLCYRHHRETDDSASFDVQKLRSIKHRHESLRGQKLFKINESLLHRLEDQMRVYWDSVVYANTSAHVAPELAVRIPVGVAATSQFGELHHSLKRLGWMLEDLAHLDNGLNDEIRRHLASLGYDLASYDGVRLYKNPFFHRNWEVHSLAIQNTLTDLSVGLRQAEVRFLEEYLKTHPNEAEVANHLEQAKASLLEMAMLTGYVD